MLILDYSSRQDPSYLASQSIGAVMRYLSHSPGKNIDRAEADALLGAGIAIGLVWETYAERPLSGYTGGISDAQAAYAQAQAVGQPTDRPIYFAVDWDASGGELALIDEYLHGAASVIGADRVGVYGSYRVVKHCHESGSAAWLWQTYAWSSGAVYHEVHLYQYSNGEWDGAVDFNEARQDDFGQWPFAAARQNQEEDMMVPAVNAKLTKYQTFARAGTRFVVHISAGDAPGVAEPEGDVGFIHIFVDGGRYTELDARPLRAANGVLEFTAPRDGVYAFDSVNAHTDHKDEYMEGPSIIVERV